MTFTLKSRGTGDLKKRYRPQELWELIPTFAITRLKKILKDPNASQVYLFEGRSGTGKTTCARILARASVCTIEEVELRPCLTCANCVGMETSGDYTEINAADLRGIDDARAQLATMAYAPMRLPYRIYVFDEVHQLTPQAQQVFLKIFEEPSPNMLIFMCTTEKKGLKKTLIDRAISIPFKPITMAQGGELLDQLVELEEYEGEIPDGLLPQMHVVAGGSVRAFLNCVQIFFEGGDFAATEDEEGLEFRDLAIGLSKKRWDTVKKELSHPSVKKAPESVRISLECWFRGCVLKANNAKAAGDNGLILECLSGTLSAEPLASQYNGLVLKCLNACRRNLA